ncbi:uncharacterized protein B0H18DRAFT_670488 [Fomitopsis serialis]|uniref:uncharacterized protein n=1 Tax=Fomitopsis serialis TaxID=139415 RepID=UPI002007BF9B|nr:uncharacterized protein B0H18DRAFT_670488 [Neoantrodia serialis]KAH9932877.1 hypothetical protein B0H18DRAFT_670488 [Neoantrodia serialis]
MCSLDGWLYVRARWVVSVCDLDRPVLLGESQTSPIPIRGDNDGVANGGSRQRSEDVQPAQRGDFVGLRTSRRPPRRVFCLDRSTAQAPGGGSAI